MVRIRDFDHERFDLRQVETGRHTIIEQRRIPQRPLLVVHIFLVQRPSDALGDAALRLPFNVARMYGAAGIQGDGATQDLDLASVGIDLDIHAYVAKVLPIALLASSDARPTTGPPVRASLPASCFKRQLAYSVSWTMKVPLSNSISSGLLSISFRCAFLKLPQRVVRCFVNGQAGRDSHAAAAGAVSKADRVSVADQRDEHH